MGMRYFVRRLNFVTFRVKILEGKGLSIWRSSSIAEKGPALTATVGPGALWGPRRSKSKSADLDDYQLAQGTDSDIIPRHFRCGPGALPAPEYFGPFVSP